MEKVEQIETGGFSASIYVQGPTKLAVISGASSAATGSNTRSDSSNPETPTDDLQDDKYYSWYQDNRFAKKVMDDLKKDYELGSFFETYTKSLYSGGLVYGTWTIDGNKRTFTRLQDDEIDLWLENTAAELYLQEAFTDAKILNQAYAALIWDGRGKEKGKIVSLSITDAVFCRNGKQNTKKVMDKVYVNGDWEGKPSEHKNYPLLDPYFGVLDQVKNAKSNILYYPIIIPGVPGQLVYQLPFWNGIREGKMLELTRLMIEHEYYYLKNATSIAYHVEVAEEHFKKKYRARWEKSDEERLKIVNEELTAFNNFVTGIENSGKSFLTFMGQGLNNTPFSYWKITPIKNQVEGGKFKDSQNTYSAAKMRAIGLRPELLGGVGNDQGKIGGGSGSAARVAHNIHSIENKAMQDLVLGPLNKVVKHINGWADRYKGLVFMTESYFIATLDQVAPDNRM